ncbi:prephenate dehydratase [Planctomycetes bacterium K23_9]|uniref:prephenate dehydratase n=1 Tax=Stieleria marina TaxID=1930275 RepID=A0A517NVB5_9BACT|nr:P-protein [Planctomycetes bacterium K23_9]
MSDAEAIQASINQVDQQFIELLSKRQTFVQALHDVKDASISQRVASAAKEIASLTEDAGTTELLRHVSSYCLRKINNVRVAFLGPVHSYSHLATMKYCGEGVEFTPVASIPAVFDAVSRGHAELGIVPIENSTDGRIVDTLGMFVRQKMHVCGEVLLPIHHNLLSRTPLSEITEVHSKPQALSQCREWLAKHLPDATLHEISSTTAAAKLAAEKHGVAAVASLPAGQEYSLDVLHSNIEDNPNNVTRFAVLGRDDMPPTSNDKTSLLFQIPHAPGALADVMNVFKECELNLTWIESFPAPDSPSEYLFFVEFAGHQTESLAAKAIQTLGGMTQRLDVLGSYAKASL